MNNFVGVKIALINNDELLVIQRDDKPNLRYAGLWDFAGGSREEDETPFECVAREVDEELGLTLNQKSVVWEKMHPAMHDPSIDAYFMVAPITDEEIANVIFGDEGQGWKMMKINEFMQSNEVVEPLKGRLSDYLNAQLNPLS
jgi:8-oxo-dGTP diphosphatase